jgi:organic radical activating enzyme
MKKQFTMGRNNLSITIMIPSDCYNACPFCESKVEYAKHKVNLPNVIQSLQRLFDDSNTQKVKEVVITGGEPMVNISTLSKILDVIPSDKDIYINTTLIQKNFMEFCEIVNTNPQIKGINVSRHFSKYHLDTLLLHNIVTDENFSRIKKSIRVNCVLSTFTNIKEIIERWENVPNVELSLRENFNTMTLNDLHSYNTVALNYLRKNLYYFNHTQCKVCDTLTFETANNFTVRYHRGTQSTLIKLDANTYEINDIIVRQDGKIFLDWIFTKDNSLDEILSAPSVPTYTFPPIPTRTFTEAEYYYSCGGGGC